MSEILFDEIITWGDILTPGLRVVTVRNDVGEGMVTYSSQVIARVANMEDVTIGTVIIQNGDDGEHQLFDAVVSNEYQFARKLQDAVVDTVKSDTEFFELLALGRAASAI